MEFWGWWTQKLAGAIVWDRVQMFPYNDRIIEYRTAVTNQALYIPRSKAFEDGARGRNFSRKVSPPQTCLLKGVWEGKLLGRSFPAPLPLKLIGGNYKK